jgi:hypothetical protein
MAFGKAHSLSEEIGDTQFVSVLDQLQIRSMTTIRNLETRFLPTESVVGGVCYISASIARPGVIGHHGAIQRIAFGEYSGPGVGADSDDSGSLPAGCDRC